MNNRFGLIPSLDRSLLAAVRFNQHNIVAVTETADCFKRRGYQFFSGLYAVKDYRIGKPFLFAYTHFCGSGYRNAKPRSRKFIGRCNHCGGFAAAPDKRNDIAAADM